MKVIRTFKLESDDPNWETRIDEAFNRVVSFAPELRIEKSPERRAFNRVTVNKEFTLEDWANLFMYGRSVFQRAISVANHPDYPELQAASVNQAADHLLDVLGEFDLWLSSNS